MQLSIFDVHKLSVRPNMSDMEIMKTMSSLIVVKTKNGMCSTKWPADSVDAILTCLGSSLRLDFYFNISVTPKVRVRVTFSAQVLESFQYLWIFT